MDPDFLTGKVSGSKDREPGSSRHAALGARQYPSLALRTGCVTPMKPVIPDGFDALDMYPPSHPLRTDCSETSAQVLRHLRSVD